MNTDIAAEAAEKELRKLFGDWYQNGKLSFSYQSEDLRSVLAIIQSAIEKATEGWRRYALRVEGACKTGSATVEKMLAHQLGLCERETYHLRQQLKSRAAHASEQDFIDCRKSAEFVVKEMFEYGWLNAVSRDQATEWLRDWLSHAKPAHAAINHSLQPIRIGSVGDMLCEHEDCLELATGLCAKHTPAHASEPWTRYRNKVCDGSVIGEAKTNADADKIISAHNVTLPAHANKRAKFPNF